MSKSPVDVDVVFHNEEQRQQADIKVEKNRRLRYPIYADGETVSGKVIWEYMCVKFVTWMPTCRE